MCWRVNDFGGAGVRLEMFARISLVNSPMRHDCHFCKGTYVRGCRTPELKNNDEENDEFLIHDVRSHACAPRNGEDPEHFDT